jgi:ribose 5-phosphate isomerase B
MDETGVQDLVRQVVYRTLGKTSADTPVRERPLITESDVRDLPFRGELAIPEGALITPLARQVAMDRQITFMEQTVPAKAEGEQDSTTVNPPDTKLVAMGADHGGFEMKGDLVAYLHELGYSVVDCGTNSTEAVDYPDFAFAVARKVGQGEAWRGILVDGAGIGSCMAANKVPGVRAAMCYDQSTAINSREHNDANVLTLGAGLIGGSLARQIVKTWLETPTGGERHARRVSKIMDIERRYLKSG